MSTSGPSLRSRAPGTINRRRPPRIFSLVRSVLVALFAVGCDASEDTNAGAPDAAQDAGSPGGDAGAMDARTADGGVDGPVAVDRLLLDNDAVERLNFEIAPDARWATLNERPRGARARYPVLFEIMPSGELRRRCEYPDASLQTNSSMQFGEAGNDPFAVGLRTDGAAFVVIRPRADGGCATLLEEVPVRCLPQEVPLAELLNPYPIRGYAGRA